jgi:hypothetical protein
LRVVHAGAAEFARPRRQRRLGHRLARGDVFGDPFCDIGPARGLPGFKRPKLPAVAPAHREVDVARAGSNVGEEICRVVEKVAMYRPEELGLWIVAGSQLGELLGR